MFHFCCDLMSYLVCVYLLPSFSKPQNTRCRSNSSGSDTSKPQKHHLGGVGRHPRSLFNYWGFLLLAASEDEGTLKRERGERGRKECNNNIDTHRIPISLRKEGKGMEVFPASHKKQVTFFSYLTQFTTMFTYSVRPHLWIESPFFTLQWLAAAGERGRG